MAEAANLTNPLITMGNPLRAFPAEPAGNSQPPPSADAPVHASLSDLVRHPALLARLPVMKPAFDADLMRARLQAALFGEEDPTCTIDSCVPGKGYYFSEDHCILQYALKVREGERRFKLVVNARLFKDRSLADAYFQDKVAPLVEKTRGR